MVNIIIDNSGSMVQYMEDIIFSINDCLNFTSLNNPFLIENLTPKKGFSGNLCTFNESVDITGCCFGIDKVNIMVSNSRKTNLGLAIKELNEIDAFTKDSINFVIIDGPISDKQLFDHEAKKIFDQTNIKSDIEDYPTFFCLSLGPICDIKECIPLYGYGYQLKDNKREAKNVIRNYFKSFFYQYLSLYPSLTLDPLLNQWRPKIQSPIKQIYELEYKN